MAIHIRNKVEIKKLRAAGAIVAQTHKLLEEHIQPGISTQALDEIAEKFIRSQGAIPSFKGYGGFPGTICASINDEVVHGIPSVTRILQDGDIISLDIGACLDGYHGDAARTHAVGKVDAEAKRLIQVTKESFFEGIRYARPGCHLHEISEAIQKHVEKNGFSVVRDLVGHGIGTELHEEPQIPNYKPMGRGPRLEVGMVFAIEPMVNIGAYEVRVLDDEWTVVTNDGSRSSHYEHTLVITDTGYELLTDC